jgi:dTDP-4-amino-4,6-dideoxygalactose transaminase
MSEPITVTKTFLPPLADYETYLESIWRSNQVTNQGPLLKEFEEAARQYLGVDYFHFVANGTLALQITLRSLGITSGEIITTPFSYVATVSAILWERCKPVFVDIDPRSLCLDPGAIEAAVTDDTKAIIPVHVFGIPSDIEGIDAVAKEYGLPVVYDGAHAFGARYKGNSLLSYGDVAVSSFHATKPFHTVEGGAVITRDRALSEQVELTKRFGHHGDVHSLVGINAKATELQAAMGLCNLQYVDDIVDQRRQVVQLYDEILSDRVRTPEPIPELDSNHAYYPVILESEAQLLGVLGRLNELDIWPRRYFYPSLNELPYLHDRYACPVSEDVSRRILCLPLYGALDRKTIETIAREVVGA